MKHDGVILGRWEVVVGILGVLVAVVFGVLTLQDDEGPDREGSVLTTFVPPTTGSRDPVTTTTSTATVAATDEIVLGRDVKPLRTEDCRSPQTGSGSAWQFGIISLRGERHYAYRCHLFPGGVGRLDFNLEQKYRELGLTIGFAEDSVATAQRVRFEVIGDDRMHLIQSREVRFGDVVDLRVSVLGTVRLTVSVSTVAGLQGLENSASEPVVAGLVMTPA